LVPVLRYVEITLIFYANSGAATTASRLGQPDLAIATLNDFVQVIDHHILNFVNLPSDLHGQSAQMVCSLDPTMPVIADADTGCVRSHPLLSIPP
jgi:hypothetical protein